MVYRKENLQSQLVQVFYRQMLLLSTSCHTTSVPARDVPDIRFRLAGYPAIFCYLVPVSDQAKILPVAG